jgi:uncharacterized DUF497 family protein
MNKGRSRVVWDDENRDHIVLDHPERKLSVTQINEVLTDPRRVEAGDPQHGTTVTVGSTLRGRFLVVAWTAHGRDGMYPVHARPAGKKERREYEEQ